MNGRASLATTIQTAGRQPRRLSIEPYNLAVFAEKRGEGLAGFARAHGGAE